VSQPFPVAGLAWWHDDWHAYRCCPYPHLHQGLDLFSPFGTPVLAVADGVVTQRVSGPISGLGVEIQAASGTQYFYAHLSGFAPGLAVGQQVRMSQVLGYVGNTGNARRTSPHLHFEIQPGGVPVPPMPIVDQWLAAAERRAEALVAERTGRAAVSGADLQRWLEEARQLAVDAEAGGEITPDQPDQMARTAAKTDPPGGASDGSVMGVASVLLLLLLIAPGALQGRREARKRSL